MVGPPTWKNPDGTQRAEIQLVTSLSVELDSPPVWCLSVMFRHHPSDYDFPLSAWKPWQRELLMEAMQKLLPCWKDRKVYPMECFPEEIQIRSPLLPHELPFLTKGRSHEEILKLATKRQDLTKITVTA